jgi:hypothetical protein
LIQEVIVSAQRISGEISLKRDDELTGKLEGNFAKHNVPLWFTAREIRREQPVALDRRPVLIDRLECRSLCLGNTG